MTRVIGHWNRPYKAKHAPHYTFDPNLMIGENGITKLFGKKTGEDLRLEQEALVRAERKKALDEIALAASLKWKEEAENARLREKWSDMVNPQDVTEQSAKYSVELYRVRGPGSNGEIGVMTTSHELAQFISGLASASAAYLADAGKGDEEHALNWIFKNAFPIAFKLAGYKAEQVVERHVLLCGSSAPAADDIIAGA